MLFSHLDITSFIASTTSAASLTLVTNYGSNYAGVPMYIYVPSILAPKPAIVVAFHECTSSGQAYHAGKAWVSSAATKGFIVIYPSSPRSAACWDVSSNGALNHNGGVDSNSIANMVAYAVNKYGADSTRVFVADTTSGVTVADVMAAASPAVVKSGPVSTILSPRNYKKEAKQWADVVGVSRTVTRTLVNNLQSGYATFNYDIMV